MERRFKTMLEAPKIISPLILSVACVSMFVGAGLVTFASWSRGELEPKPDKKLVSFDPDKTVCFVFDMSTKKGKFYTGLHPMSYSKRYEVSDYVSRGLADWRRAKTLDCYRLDENPLIIREKIFTTNMEWWQWR